MKFHKLIIISAAAMLVSGGAYAQRKNGISEYANKIANAEQIISQLYVDDVDENKLAEEAIKAMLKTLDPHSLYSDPAETKELTTPLEGNFSGIGIQFSMLGDTLRIIQTIVGGPSEKVGLQPGDRILMANDSVMSGAKRSNSGVQKILKGPKGTTVDLVVERRGAEKPLNFRVVRDDIPIESVDAAYMVTPTIGFISVTNFAEKTPEELHNAILRLKSKGMTDLILDLQDNGGGYMHSAVEMAGEFLKQGDLVVSTKAPRMNANIEYRVENKGLMPTGKIVVLANQYSASASEILSGAIQDHDRGLVVGRRTFGKGLVQRPIPFSDGSMIRLTVARYYTPSGRTIQKPYTKGDTDDYELDILNRYRHGEFSNADSIHFADSLKTSTLRNGRTIFGGGGIMPDVFVGIDTIPLTPFYRDIVAKGLINRVATEYIDNNRQQLKKEFPNEDVFVEKFQVPESMISRLLKLAENDSIKFVQEQYDLSENTIRTILKGLVGRDLFETGTYARIVNPLNPIFNEALRVISDDKRYETLLSGKKE